MRGKRKELLLAALLAMACGGRASDPDVPRGVPPVRRVPAVPKDTPTTSPCRVLFAAVPPSDSVRVGVADVLADPEASVMREEDAKELACPLGATHAVREQAYVNREGELRWTLGLYRAGGSSRGAPAPDPGAPGAMPDSAAPIRRPAEPAPLQSVPRPPPEAG